VGKRRLSSTFALVALLLACALAKALVLLGEPPDLAVEPWLPRALTLDVNRDPAARLQLLPRVGPARAAAIVRERERSGSYRGVGSLRRVPGIGPRTVEALSDSATAGG
jgi:competence ComEA-like helix-hairpin-helix protein